MKRILAILSLVLGGAASVSAQSTVFYSENFDGLTDLPSGWTSNIAGGAGTSGTLYTVSGGVFSFTEAVNGGGVGTGPIDVSSAVLADGVAINFDLALGDATYNALAIGFTTTAGQAGPDQWVLGFNQPDVAISTTVPLNGDLGSVSYHVNIAPSIASYSSSELTHLRIFLLPRLPSNVGDNPFTNFGTLTIDNFSVSGTSAVPEPSTYAALAGLAALGFVAWRRRAARA